MTDQATAQLNAHLAEHARLVGENHTTFQRQQHQITAMIVLLSGIIGFIVTNLQSVSQHPEPLLLIPIPFLLLTALHLRDDLKLQAIDEYIWIVLRERVKTLTGLKDNDRALWNWLQVADRFKFSFSIDYGIFFMLSVTRYMLPFLTILASLYAYIVLVSSFIYSPWYWTSLLILDFIATMYIFGVGGRAIIMGGNYVNGHPWITRGLHFDT